MKNRLLLFAVLFAFSLLSSAQEDTGLTQYTGRYIFAPGSVTESIEISIKDGNLYGLSSAGEGSLVRVRKDTFSIPAYNGMAYFSRNSEGKVKGIRIEVDSTILIGDKSPSSIALVNRRRFREAFVKK